MMGYTISMHAENAKKQAAMEDFMLRHYRPAHKIFSGDADFSRFAVGKDLSYEHHKLALGFDFNASDPEREYIFAVTRWMALQVGQPRKVKGLGLVPVYYYDGGDEDGPWPILVKDEWKDKAKKYRWCLTDSTGMHSISDHFVGTPFYDEASPQGKKDYIKERSEGMKGLFGYSLEETYNRVRKELIRLDRLWKKCGALK